MNQKLLTMFTVIAISTASQAFGSCENLLNAAYDGNLPAVKELLDAGTDINCKGNLYREHKRAVAGYGVQIGDSITPLQAAVLGSTSNVSNVMRLLLQQGAKVNTFDAYHYTAAHHAVQWRRYEALKVLVSAGAILTLRNKGSHTPEELARILMVKHPELEKIADTLKMWRESYNAYWIQQEDRDTAYHFLDTYKKSLPNGSLAFWERVDSMTAKKREGDEQFGYYQIFNGEISNAELASQVKIDTIRVPLKQWTAPSTLVPSGGFWTETKNRQSAFDFLEKYRTRLPNGSVAFWQRINPKTGEKITGSEAIGYHQIDDGKIAGADTAGQKFVDETLKKSLTEWVDSEIIEVKGK